MNLFFKRFLSTLFLCVTLPSLYLNVSCAHNGKSLNISESFVLKREKLKSELEKDADRTSKFLENKESLLNCVSSIYIDGFETERLILDEAYSSDIKPLAKLINDKDVYKYLYYSSDCNSINENFKFTSEKQAMLYVTYPFFECNKAYFEFINTLKTGPKAQKLRENATFKCDRFVIRKKDTREPMGWIGFDIKKIGSKIFIEIDYFLGKIYQKKGYAQEAAIALSQKIFGSISEGVFIVNHHKLNEDSRKLANKILNKLMEDPLHTYELTTLNINNMVRYNLEKTDKSRVEHGE